jgi:hypothetical protein
VPVKAAITSQFDWKWGVGSQVTNERTERVGFYSRGGGIIEARVTPITGL